jgi:peroxiredoxin
MKKHCLAVLALCLSSAGALALAESPAPEAPASGFLGAQAAEPMSPPRPSDPAEAPLGQPDLLRVPQQVGQPANDIKGLSSTGAATALSAYRGKVIVLDVSAMWCIWCQKDAPAMEYLWNTYKAKGLEVVTCLTETENGTLPATADLRRWVSSYKLTDPVMNDASGTRGGIAERAYIAAGEGFPTIAVIDKTFVVRYLQGGLDLAAVTASVKKLLAE